MTNQNAKRKIIGKECRHVVHVTANREEEVDDVHLIKEQVHYDDGTIEPNLCVVKNYPRNFYITKKAYQNHKQKKDWEDIEKLDKFTCTQSQLTSRIAKALGTPYVSDLRQLKRSPYVYGIDIDSRALIAKDYHDKYSAAIGIATRYSVAAFDVETDVVNSDSDDDNDDDSTDSKGDGKIIMGSLTFKNRTYTAVVKSFMDGVDNPHQAVMIALEKHIGDILLKRGITNPIIEFVDSQYEVIKRCFEKAHEWKPDVISIFNIAFEMDKMFEAAKAEQFDLVKLLSDPSVPKKYQKLVWKPGKHQKITASGKFTPVKPHNRWPVVEVMAGFKMICSMCTYRHIRLAKQEESSYSLDAILEKEVKITKLKIPEADMYVKTDWHFFMQVKKKAEYIVYNIFDCIALEILDEKTADLARGLPLNLGFSDSSLFGSQPSRTVESEYHYALTKGSVMACVSPEMRQPIDDLIYPLKGWIIALRAHLIADNGLRCIAEAKNMRTNVHTHVGDLDVLGAYPHGQIVYNICKASTAKEVIGIRGYDSYTLRMQGINIITGGHTNAVEFCTTMLEAPALNVLLREFHKIKGIQSSPSLMAYMPDRHMISLRSDEDDEEEDAKNDPYAKIDEMLAAA